MKFQVALMKYTLDCQPAAQQVIEALNRALAEGAVALPDAGLDVVLVATELVNPFGSPPSHEEPSLASNELLLPTTLSYADWVEPNWEQRVQAVVTAGVAGLDAAVSASLISEAARHLVAALEAAGKLVCQQSPDRVVPLGPVFVTLGSDGQFLGAGAKRPEHQSFGPWRFVEVAPQDVLATAARYHR